MTDIENMIVDAVTMHTKLNGLYTRRQWLTTRAIMAGCSIWESMEAVSSIAIEHPEVDMDEEKTWEEWQQQAG